MLDAMDRDGIDDPELLLAVLVHDLGKLLLVAGEDPANVVCMNSPIGEPTPGVGLDQCTFQWNHDEFGGRACATTFPTAWRGWCATTAWMPTPSRR